MTSPKQFHLEDFVSARENFHLARVTIHSRLDLSMHHHDYAEIFWVENGQGIHQVNGQKIPLQKGHLVMMRPTDYHTFSSPHGLTIMNLAFFKDTLLFLRERYFADRPTYFWTKNKLPYQVQLPIEEIQRISARAEQAVDNPKDRLQLDSLLLFIFNRLSPIETYTYHPDMPSWLQNALHSYHTPYLFQQGIKGFVELCKRNPDYINRVLKKFTGKSLTETVNELKVKYTARQLALTQAPIKQIAIESGFNNISHFYAVFKHIKQHTPRQYRKINQRIV
jgi:AraC family cel operon transcriptional repressor